jgi:peptidyl-prolyl cis-trans isomerase A (cyclophilin A)
MLLPRALVLGGLVVGATAVAAPDPTASQAAPPPPIAIQLTADAIEIDGHAALSTDALFDVGAATLKPDAQPIVTALARVVQESGATVRIDCYTDDIAPDGDRSGQWLQRLSAARADALRAQLIKRGAPAKRLTASGLGATQPKDNAEASRRIELVVVREVRPPVAADLATYAKSIPGTGPLTATLSTSMGALHCALFDDRAPMTVANFIGLATGQKAWRDPDSSKTVRNKPFYNGLIFHRVIPHFMIQGGDPRGVGTGGPGYTFDDELAPDLHHQPGALAMANAGPSTNGSQFFIDDGTNAWLDGKHTIFGQCKELDLISKMAAVPRGAADLPSTPIVIKKITIQRGK